MIEINTSGRTDIENYFKMSGVLSYKKLTDTPFLVFEVEPDKEVYIVNVKIVDNKDKLLAYPDSTKVMGQWRGEWKSDYFQFTVGQLREYLEKR